MTTAYTSLLGLALPVTGELSGTWGDTVNTAITSLLDTAIAGTTSITTDADITLSTTTGASNQARQAIILWNPASGTTTRNITAPAQSKMYVVINASGGTQSIVIRGVGPTTGVTIAKGESATVAWNGSDFVKVSSSGGAITFTDLTVTGNTILGDAAADTLTVNATSTFASPVNFQGLVKLPSTGRSAAAALTVTAPAFLYGVASTYTDTTSSGTIAAMAPFYALSAPTLSTSNVTTYTNAATLYIAGAPAAGGSATITNPYALYIAAGNMYFGGSVASNLLFVDNTYDIGASGATRPRTGYFGTSVVTPALTVSGLTSGRVPYLTTGGLFTSSANLTFDGQTLTATNNGAATGPLVPSYALSVAGNTNLGLNLSATGETYTAGTASSKFEYVNSGTIAIVTASTTTVNSGALIDFNAYNSSGGATNIYLGAVAGSGGGGAAANFVVGRRTGVASWAESLRLDSSGNLQLNTTTPKVTTWSGSGNGMTIGGASAPGLAVWDTTDASYVGYIYQANADTAIGNNAAGNLTFSTSNTERGRFASTGQFGIGETSPQTYSKLVVRNDTASGAGSGAASTIWLLNANATANNASTIFFGDNAAAAAGAINFVNTNHTTDYGLISFDTNGVNGYGTRLTITSAGDTEVGTAYGLGRKLNVNSATNGYTMGLLQTGAYNSGNSSGVVFQGYYDGSSITDLASIRGGKENGTSGNYAGFVSFWTRPNGGSDTERGRFDSGGNFLVGASSGALAKLYVVQSDGQAFQFDTPSGVTQQGIGRFNNSTNGSYLAVAGVGTTSVVPSWANGSMVLESVPFISTGNFILSAYQGNLIFQTDGRTERGRFVSSGGLAIGGTTAPRLLTLSGGGASISVNDSNGGIYMGTGGSGGGGFASNCAIARAEVAGYHVGSSQVGDLCIGPTAGSAVIFGYGASGAVSLDLAMKIAHTGVVSTSGNLVVGGALSKGSGSFRIEHPLPQLAPTHQLVHSFIEGPQADLIYRGKVNLVGGTATVNIDTAAGMTEGTFVVLCRDVQCFTTNESDWTAVRGAVSGNILTIEAQDQTSTSSISWMVIGERQDKHMYDTDWTDDNGKVIVEPLKPIEA